MSVRHGVRIIGMFQRFETNNRCWINQCRYTRIPKKMTFTARSKTFKNSDFPRGVVCSRLAFSLSLLCFAFPPLLSFSSSSSSFVQQQQKHVLFRFVSRPAIILSAPPMNFVSGIHICIPASFLSVVLIDISDCTNCNTTTRGFLLGPHTKWQIVFFPTNT